MLAYIITIPKERSMTPESSIIEDQQTFCQFLFFTFFNNKYITWGHFEKNPVSLRLEFYCTSTGEIQWSQYIKAECPPFPSNRRYKIAIIIFHASYNVSNDAILPTDNDQHDKTNLFNTSPPPSDPCTQLPWFGTLCGSCDLNTNSPARDQFLLRTAWFRHSCRIDVSGTNQSSLVGSMSVHWRYWHYVHNVGVIPLRW